MKKSDAEVFLEVLRYIASSSLEGLTKTQANALRAISEKLEANQFNTREDLVAFLNTPAKKARTSRAKTSGSTTKPTVSKKPPHSEGLAKSLCDELFALELNKEKFETKVDAIKAGYFASTLKAVANKFAPGASAKNTEDAVRILKAERNDRRRADQKSEQAAKANPW